MGFEQIIGNSKALKHVLQQLKQFAASDSRFSLLEKTGHGKEFSARAIPRPQPPSEAHFCEAELRSDTNRAAGKRVVLDTKGSVHGAITKKSAGWN